MLKEYLKNQVDTKRSQIETLEKAMIESESKEEREKTNETLVQLRSELAEAEKLLQEEEAKEEKEQEEQEELEGKNAEERRMQVIGSYGMRGAMIAAGMDTREKEINEELEKRGKALKEQRAVTVSSSELVLPNHTGTALNDTFTPVSTLVDRVATESLNGGESYEEAYVAGYGTGGIVDEGADYTTAEPVFGYAPINKIKVTAYAEISEEVKKLPNIDYARKVQEACSIALKKKLSQQIIAGTGTKEMVGICASPDAINAAKDVDITEIGLDTLDEAIFGYGGDEDVETQAALILNKKTLKELSEVRKANGDKAYNVDVKNRTIDTIPYVINSNLPDFATAANGKHFMLYGDLSAYKTAVFSPVEIMESSDYKFKQGMICFRASVFVGGNVVKQDGFIRLKKKDSLIKVKTPQAEPAEASQDLSTGISVTLTCGTADAKIYYTLDGSEPGAEKTLYSTPVSIQTEEASKTLKAVAIKTGMEDSDVLEVTYTNSGMTDVELNSVLKTAATKTESVKKV